MNSNSQKNSFVAIWLTLSFCFFSFQTFAEETDNVLRKFNSQPKFSSILPIHIIANSTKTIELNATFTNSIAANDLPNFVDFTDFGNGNASFTIFPNNLNAGDYTLNFVASNTLLSSGISIELKIYPDNNLPSEKPVFNIIDDISMSADSVKQLRINSSYTNQIVAPNLPAFISFQDYKNGSSELYIQPDGINVGNHILEFFALGPHGIDTLNLKLNIEAGLVAPQDSQCHLSTVKMVSDISGFEHLFDEQYLTSDPIANTSSHPQNPWSPGWDWSLYPSMGYIDLGSPQPITRIFLNDGFGGGTFNVYVGSSPTDYDTSAVVVNHLPLLETWHEHEINQTTQYLFFEMFSPQALVTEALIYGLCDLEIDTFPPSQILDLQIEKTTSKTTTLSWHSSGDDLNQGYATTYDIRYSTSPITDSNFETLPSFIIKNNFPLDTILTKTLSDLDCDTEYYFAVKAIDDVNNTSTISNIANTTTSICNPNITITVSFENNLNTIPNIEPTTLRFDKDFVYSLTLDDGSLWEYNVTLPILNGGVTPDGKNNDGFYYTDGCGNEEVFRAGISINGSDILDEPYGSTFMTWDDMRVIYNADWDILNHSFTHCTDTCDYASEVINNVNIVEDKLGFTMTHFVVPAGDNEGYQLLAFDNGMLSVHSQYFPTPYNYGIQVDEFLNLDSFVFHRNTLENEIAPYGEDIDSVATLVESENHLWFSEYAHRIGYPTDPFIYVNVNDFKEYMTHIENNYGRFGSDNLWFAPLQEVYEYISVRDNIEITNIEINNNQLTFQISTTNIPATFRRNSLSLKIDSNNLPNISNIEVTNANFTFNSDGLINLNW